MTYMEAYSGRKTHIADTGRKLPSVSTAQAVDSREGRTPDSLPRSALSPRQQQVLDLLTQGNLPTEIAYKLGISVKTVETLKAQALQRLGINDSAERRVYIFTAIANSEAGPSLGELEMPMQRREILNLIQAGKFNHEIASILSISIKNVELNIKKLLALYGVSNRRQLVVKARRNIIDS